MQWHGKVVSITRDPLDDALAHCHAVMARGSVADSHADSPSDSHAARPDSHAPGAWPEPYDPAGDADASPDSLNAGLDRLGNHHPGEGGFGRVDRAQSMDRQGRDVPPDGREPVRDPHREAADAMTREAAPLRSGALTRSRAGSIPALPAMLLLSAMLAMTGCASNAKTVLTSANKYRWHHARHAEACPAAPDCAERGRLLNRWWEYLGEAETAITKGGDMPLQIKSLKSVEKEARKWEP